MKIMFFICKRRENLKLNFKLIFIVMFWKISMFLCFLSYVLYISICFVKDNGMNLININCFLLVYDK